MDLKLAAEIVPGKTNNNGLGYLDYYSGHNVYHPGWDINVGAGWQDYGMPILCPAKGEVVFVSPAPTRLNGYNGGFGWYVVVYHPDLGIWTRYAHCKAVLVREGQAVKKGTQLAELGNTGTSSPHCHFDAWRLKMQAIQESRWRKYAFYPSGWSKTKVAEYFVDPAFVVTEGIKLENKIGKPMENTITIDLYRVHEDDEEEGGKIYSVVDGEYYHIADMQTFNIVTGGRPVNWGEGAKPRPEDVKGTLQLI